MELLLAIESATDNCSVSICNGDELIGSVVCTQKRMHDTKLAELTDKLLKKHQIKVSDLEAVAVSEGPGSYMGLRIGVALAKGLAYGANIKLIGISTLEVLANDAFNLMGSEFNHIVPMIDAGRMEVYTGIFDGKCNKLSDTEAMILNSESFNDIRQERVLFAGSGAPKFIELLKNTMGELPSNIKYVDISPSSEGLIRPAIKALREKKFADIAYFQPFYLKEFIPGKQKKLL